MREYLERKHFPLKNSEPRQSQRIKIRLQCPGALYGNGIAQTSQELQFDLSYLYVAKILANMADNVRVATQLLLPLSTDHFPGGKSN